MTGGQYSMVQYNKIINQLPTNIFRTEAVEKYKRKKKLCNFLLYIFSI